MGIIKNSEIKYKHFLEKYGFKIQSIFWHKDCYAQYMILEPRENSFWVIFDMNIRTLYLNNEKNIDVSIMMPSSINIENEDEFIGWIDEQIDDIMFKGVEKKELVTYIYTDNESMAINLNDIASLEAAMRFKSEHIKAKAQPILFETIANKLKELERYERW